MAPPAAGGAEVAAGGGRQQQGFGQMLTGVIRVAVFWYFASKFFSPKRSPTEPSQQISNLFQRGEPLTSSPSYIPEAQNRSKGRNGSSGKKGVRCTNHVHSYKVC